jgi:hypothetical protein
MALTLERRSVAVGDHNIADRNAVGELVTHEYDGIPAFQVAAAGPSPCEERHKASDYG